MNFPTKLTVTRIILSILIIVIMVFPFEAVGMDVPVLRTGVDISIKYLVCCILFIINALIFGYGIKYSDKTIEALEKISYDLSQKEDYEVRVLNKSNVTSANDLKNKKKIYC